MVTDGIVGYRGDDNAVERSRVDPAGAQATRSTRLLVEFVAKGAPRQGTSSRDGSTGFQDGMLRHRSKGQTLVTEPTGMEGVLVVRNSRLLPCPIQCVHL